MAEFTEKSHPLARVHEQLKGLAAYGNNSVFRRVMMVVEAEMGITGSENTTDDISSLCGPDREPHCRPDRCANFSFLDAREEVAADDRRRTVLLDPSEAYASHLIDLYSGRLSVLEARDQQSLYDTGEIRERALNAMRGSNPVVTVNIELAESISEVAHMLRHMAELLESGQWSALQANALDSLHNDAVATLLAEECFIVATETLGSRWVSTPRRLEYHFRDKYDCVRRDPCCGNQTHRIEYRNDRWTAVWTDSGSPNDPPPQPPPAFQHEPWNNRLPVFDDQNVGTLTSKWGWRNLNGAPDFHGGIDIAAPALTVVRNIMAGQVVHIAVGAGHQVGVVLRVGNQTHTYWHIDPVIGLSIGQNIPAGTDLGAVSGAGPQHLHFAVHEPPNGDWTQRNDGNSRNPLP